MTSLIEQLEKELRECPATPAGYREAEYMRHRLAALKSQSGDEG